MDRMLLLLCRNILKVDVGTRSSEIKAPSSASGSEPPTPAARPNEASAKDGPSSSSSTDLSCGTAPSKSVTETGRSDGKRRGRSWGKDECGGNVKSWSERDAGAVACDAMEGMWLNPGKLPDGSEPVPLDTIESAR